MKYQKIKIIVAGCDIHCIIDKSYLIGVDLMKNCKLIAAWLFSLSLIFVLLVSCIDFHAFNKNYYYQEYAALNTATNLGMSEDDLNAATDALLDYLHDERQDILVTGEVFGVEREIFTERETLHMIDVKALYQGVLTARNIAVLLAILMPAILVFIFKREKGSMHELLNLLFKSFLQVSLCLLVAVAILAGYALMDFTAFWTGFHELFFTNDLWLLNPAESIMINMFPETFFAGMVFRITASFIVIYGLVLVLLVILRKKTTVFDKKVIDKKS